MSETSVLQRPSAASRRRNIQRRLGLSAEPSGEGPGIVAEGPPVRPRRPRKAMPAKTDGGRPDHSPPPPIFHPLAYRSVVAAWSLEARERWGRRSNALEDAGLAWRDAETQAFVEIWNELRRGGFADPDHAG